MLSPLNFPLDRIIDAEGRPLFEGRASKDMQAIAPLEHVVCPYSGSRYKHEKPMNLSGLRQMRGHWDDVIAGLEYLRDLYPQATSQLRYIDLWRICNMGHFLTAFLIYRRREPIPNGQLPGHVAGIYKIVIGLIHAAQELAFANLFRGAGNRDDRLDYDQLYSFVEERKLLIGPTEVCAGPEALIKEVVGVLKNKPAAPDSAQKTKLLVGDEKAFLDFSYCRMNSAVLDYIYSIIAESLHARIRKAMWPVSQSGDPFFQADSPLALLVNVDGAIAQAMLGNIIKMTVSDDPGDGRLGEAAKQMSGLFRNGNPSPVLLGLLGDNPLAAGVAEDISRYLQLERISFDVSRILKEKCLAALGLEDSLHLNAISRDFFPPDLKMRSLLHMMFGIEILPNLQVRSKRAIAMSLQEDSPWSSGPEERGVA